MANRWVGCLIVGAALAISLAPAAPAAAAPASEGLEQKVVEKAEHGGELNPLAFERDTALWTAVVFLVLLAVLWRFAWGPISEGLMRREQRVAEQIAQAHEINEQARRLLDEHQQKLATAQDEVRAILERAAHEAEHVGQQIIAKAKAETELEKQRAVHEIETATSGALKELAERSATLAVDLAGKIVQAKLDPRDHARLIERAVADFAQQRGNN
jgi:F-type H+-transporting ATPase subunit b